MAKSNHYHPTGDPYLDGRLGRYADPSQIDKIIKEAAAEFNKGANPSDSRRRIIKYFETHARFVFVPGKGWYDLMHAAAAYAASQTYSPENALALGWGVEIAEGFGVFGWNNTGSAYQAEDFRSNRLGAVMMLTGQDARGILGTNNIPNAEDASKLGKAELMRGAGRVDELFWKKLIGDLMNFVSQAPSAVSAVCVSPAGPDAGLKVTGTLLS
jgi:hypothetical protein